MYSTEMKIIMIVAVIWYIITIIQIFLGYGTAYRKTKANGDTGTALLGWLLFYAYLAANIPFLGFYLWKKNKN